MGSTLFCSVFYYCQIKEVSRHTQWRSSSLPYLNLEEKLNCYKVGEV